MSDIIKFTIGKTRSGKPFFSFASERIGYSEIWSVYSNSYSEEDIFDIYCSLEYLIGRSIRKNGSNSKESFNYETNKKIIVELFLSKQKIAELKKKHGIFTSLDVCKFGSNLVSIEFKHL